MNKPRRVVCAAIRSENGKILIGIRHYSEDMHNQIQNRIDGKDFHHLGDDNQGFVDQHGVYMTRREAYLVALGANQIINENACSSDSEGKWTELYSEALY
jgi:hypothetical protein